MSEGERVDKVKNKNNNILISINLIYIGSLSIK